MAPIDFHNDFTCQILGGDVHSSQRNQVSHHVNCVYCTNQNAQLAPFYNSWGWKLVVESPYVYESPYNLAHQDPVEVSGL